MRVAILGAQGQLGSDLCQQLGADAIPWRHADADLARPESLASALAANQPDVVINGAAFNFVDRAEREPDAAFAVNAVGVFHLARLCHEKNIPLVHCSTDYVFGRDLDRTLPFRESDLPAPSCVYGVSKLTGEYLALQFPKTFVVRTCGLYGLAGRTSAKGNFVEMILKQLAQNKPLRVVTDQRCTPTFSLDLARAIASLIQTRAYGLYHITNSGDCTWYDFAQAILELTGFDESIQPMRTADFGSAARRPGYSVLDGDKFNRLGLGSLRPWREALAEYLSLRQGNVP